MNLFDYLNSIENKSKLDDSSKSSCSGYMLALSYSLSNSTISDANRINKVLFDLKNEDIYNYFFDVVPKKRIYKKWPKKLDTFNKEEVEKFANNNNMSFSEALNFILED